MKPEDKQLLLKDLNARLPYGVKVATRNPAAEIGVVSGISIKGKISVSTKDADIVFECTEVKPYLRPMSSMTEEERIESLEFAWIDDYGRLASYNENIPKYIDWLNKKMFDYRGLIPMGLAIAVTRENNPYKTLKA